MKKEIINLYNEKRERRSSFVPVEAFFLDKLKEKLYLQEIEAFFSKPKTIFKPIQSKKERFKR